MPSQAALVRDRVSERIRNAAIALFRARGYHGTSVRALAQVVRIEAASLYYHFPSKQNILLDIFERTMDDLLEGLRGAVEGRSSPEERLRAVVRFHVLFHTERQDEAFISHSELRSLTGPNLRRITGKRDQYEAMFHGLLAAGVRARVFEAADIRLVTIAVLTMCSGVADWFSEGSRLDAEAVADGYADIVLRLVRRTGGSGAAVGVLSARRAMHGRVRREPGVPSRRPPVSRSRRAQPGGRP
jgi:AcrR family transcriptional regulator